MPAIISFLTADDGLLRRVTELLAPKGWRVLHAGPGSDGRFEDEGGAAPDLILVDTCLQDSDAATVVEGLRGRGVATPILILADREAAESVVAAVRSGADDALFKPIEPLGLPARVRGLLLQAELSEAKERLQTLEFRNSELESFIYIVTHDMKTPVVNLQGLVGLVEQDHGDALPAEVQDYLKRLRRNAERLEELLRDLLEYPRRLSLVGSKTLESLATIAEVAVDGLRENAEAAGVKVIIEPDLPSLRCDPKRVQQVIHNLVENAIKYAGRGSDPRVVIGAKTTAEGLRCHVKDNGPGIPADQLTEVFKLFHRVPGSGDKADGSGIGLAVARQLVEAHGGEIWCESAEGRGATFYFTLGDRG